MCRFWAESGRGKPRMMLLIKSKVVLEYGTQDSYRAKATAVWILWAVRVSLHNSVGTETRVPRTSPGIIYIEVRICLFTAAFVTVSKVYISLILEGRKLDGYVWRCVLNTMYSCTKLSNNNNNNNNIKCWREGLEHLLLFQGTRVCYWASTPGKLQPPECQCSFLSSVGTRTHMLPPSKSTLTIL